jgi:hypothetical protein
MWGPRSNPSAAKNKTKLTFRKKKKRKIKSVGKDVEKLNSLYSVLVSGDVKLCCCGQDGV